MLIFVSDSVLLRCKGAEAKLAVVGANLEVLGLVVPICVVFGTKALGAAWMTTVHYYMVPIRPQKMHEVWVGRL